jgi:SAM-dependent methyltransferase
VRRSEAKPSRAAVEAPDVAGEQSSSREYWSRRLGEHFSFRGTGHLSYSEAYNRWLYRAKRRALAPLLDGIDSGGRVLDVGSGTGWVVGELRARGLEVEGCDLVAPAVERLRARFEDVPFFIVELGADPIPREDAAFDAVTALDVLYHVTGDAAWERALAELARVLRVGGELIVSDGLGDSERTPAEHVRFRSLERWRAAAAPLGLRIDEVTPLYRWLSRDPGSGLVARVPGAVRGPIEYGLELAWRRRPHMRIASLRRVGP